MLIICPLLVFILSIVAHRTLIPMRLRYSFFFGNFIFPIIALVIIGILTYILYKFYFKAAWQKRNPDHTDPLRNIKLIGSDSLWIANEEWCKAFMELNGDKVKRID